MEGLLQCFGVGVLTQVEEFKYLLVLFTNEGKIEWENGRWIGVAAGAALICRLYVMKRTLTQKVKLVDLCVATARTRPADASGQKR